LPEKHLHIICLNVPYPVDYGGVFDLFYKLPAIKQSGVKIHLHCFEYGRGEQPALNEYCENVYYYKRLQGLKGCSLKLPYIVASRKNDVLLNRLLQDDYPVLMEGIHCTYLLNDARFTKRRCVVRLHNVEHIYYKNLFKSSNSIIRKLYCWHESKMLLPYEKSIIDKATFLAVTPKDADVYREIGCDDIEYLPLFLPDWQVKSSEGKGYFCLYHGDLSVAENEKAAEWLLKEVFAHLEIPLVIAGKDPSRRLSSLVESKTHTCIVANPTEKEMQDMIEKAHINIIPSFNNTGIKLKLINALFNGRHCVVNESTVKGTKLETACHIASDATSFKSVIKHLFHQPFTSNEIEVRHQLLDGMFDNEANAKKLVTKIWKED
jgi:hypothetical protein